MPRFRDWAVGIKISLAFGLLAIVVVGASAYQIFSINSLEESFRRLINVDTQRLTAAQDLGLANKTLNIDVNKYVNNGFKPSDRSTLMQQIENFDASFDMYNTFTSPYMSDALPALVKKNETQAMTVMKTTGAGQATTDALNTYNRSEMLLDDTISLSISKEKDGITHSYSEIDKRNADLLRSIVTVAVTTAILAVALGWTVSRWVSMAITRVRLGAQRFANGDLSHAILVHSKDEFGLLAEAFNLMARRLQESYKRLSRLDEKAKEDDK
jgi:methyl-accepting chemotaxis protein